MANCCLSKIDEMRHVWLHAFSISQINTLKILSQNVVMLCKKEVKALFFAANMSVAQQNHL